MATYWEGGRDSEWVAEKLGITAGMVDAIYDHLEWNDQAVALVEDERQALDDELDRTVADPDS